MNEIEEHLRNSLNFQAQIVERQAEMIERMKMQMQRITELQTRYEKLLNAMENTILMLQEYSCVPYLKIGKLIIGKEVKVYKNDTRKIESGNNPKQPPAPQH